MSLRARLAYDPENDSVANRSNWSLGGIADVMRNDQRHFYIYDLEVGARKAGAELPSMVQIFPIWQRMSAANRVFPIRRGDATLILGGAQLDQRRDVITLLVRLSDTKTPNSVYSDPVAGTFNEHQKIGGEGADFGCHVLISATAERGIPNIYTCAIEKVPGLSADLVRRLLSKLLNYEYHGNPTFFSYRHPGGGQDAQGAPRMERCCPHIELRGRPSDTLIDDINNGHLTGVSLVKTEVSAPIDGAAYLTKKTSELKLDVDRQHLPAKNLWGFLKAALNKNSRNYQRAKIAYKIPGTTRTVTVEVDAATGNPLEELYIKSFELNNIVPFLAQSAHNIVPHLRDLAVPELIQNRTV